MGEEDRGLGRLLVEADLITPKELQEALDYQKSIGGKLGRILSKLGYVGEQKLLEFVAEQQGLEVVSLKGVELDNELLKLAPKEFWLEHEIIPYDRDGRTLRVAMGDASDIPAIDELRFTANVEVVPVLASDRDIQALLNKRYHKDEVGAHSHRRRAGIREIAREVEARGPVKGEREKQIEEVMKSDPADLARALATLMIEKEMTEPAEILDKLSQSS